MEFLEKCVQFEENRRIRSRQIVSPIPRARLFRTRISVRNVEDTVRFFITECYYISYRLKFVRNPHIIAV